MEKDWKQLAIDLAKAIPEWMIYGNWDTPRCIVCGGWQFHGPVGSKDKIGHKPGCKRVKVLESTPA